ncbi:MAG: Do family serine endopeptidase [Candidatus Zixiibacteriota bacterium]
MSTKGRTIWAVVVVLIVFLGGISLGLQWRGATGGSELTAVTDTLHDSLSGPPEIAVPPAMRWAGERSLGFADVAARITPAVVNVSSERVVVTRDRVAAWDPFFDFFGPRYYSIPRQRHETSLGSGVIVSDSGIVLTNNHVIEGAQEIDVILADSRRLSAQLLGTDPATDVAVLRVNAAGLPAVPLGNSDSARIGDVVLAFGNPFGIGQTVTMGIVSATGRSELGLVDYENFIQTDAAINPGNSGGALVDVSGRLIGINTAIFSRSGGYQGIGFAVPINIARYVMESILEKGKITRGSIGASYQDIDAAMAEAFRLADNRGALVNTVTSGGSADHAGLRRGDVIVAFAGRPVADAVDLRRSIALSPVGGSVEIGYLRGGDRRTAQVRIAEEETKYTYLGAAEQSGKSPIEGIVVETLDRHTAERMGLKAETQGVIIKEILSNTPAARSGLREGDAVLEINREPVDGVEAFKTLMAKYADKPIVLLLSRAGALYYLSLSP